MNFYATTEMRSLLAVLSLVLFAGICVKAESSEEEPDCFMCTAKINSSIESVANMLYKVEPLRADMMKDGCKYCNITGLKKIRLLSEVCPKEVEGDTFDHNAALEQEMLTINCECTFKADPAGFMSQLSTMLSSPISPSCPNGEQPDLNMMQTPDMGSMSSAMSPMQLMQLNGCKGLKPSMPSFGKKAPTELTGILHAEWPQWRSDMIFRSIKSKQDTTVYKILMKDDNFDKVKMKCQSLKGAADDPFLALCGCIVETDLPRKLLCETAKLCFPCYIPPLLREHKDMNKKLTCVYT